MKKISYFVFFVIMLFVFSMPIYASKIVVITGNDVRFRSGPTTSVDNILENFNDGVELTLLEENGGTGNGCDAVWYKVQYGSQVGYVCSKFARIEEIEEIKPEDYEEYSEYLSELGFPDNYVSKLVLLHAKHPGWQFKIMNVNYDFDKLVKLEYDGYSKGWSLIEDTGSYYDGYKSFDNWSYNYLNNIFNNNFTGGGDNWYAASKNTIAYYVDPRNFLDESHIFMFENLGYNQIYHTKEGIELMLKGTFMESGYADSEKQKTYADAFIDAAVAYDVSPYVLVSRVIQEVGAKGSTIVSGTVSGYEGYYNFYNIKAYGDSSNETIINGLKYAKSQGWDTHYKAIIGGASFLGDDYIAAGQDSLYLQKWDVIGTSIGTHQYMQNIQAPYHEASKTYNGYNKAGLINSSFVFTIPVFNNMPTETVLPNKGNPNNYLSSLAVNGGYLFKTATTETEFNLNLHTSTVSVEISATKVSDKATISGTGTISLSGEKQVIPITVTAQNGDVRTYNINVTRSDKIAIAIGEILNILNIKNDETYMYGFDIGTDISLIKKNIIDKEPRAEVSSFDKDGKSKTSGVVASGDKIKIKTDTEEKEYTVVLYGEINGDGVIDKLDALAVLRYYYKYTSYDGAFKGAADVNGDSVIDKLDALAILRDYYGYAKIEQ